MGGVVFVASVVDAGLADHRHIVLDEILLSPEELGFGRSQREIPLEFLVIFILAVLVHPILMNGPRIIPHEIIIMYWMEERYKIK